MPINHLSETGVPLYLSGSRIAASVLTLAALAALPALHEALHAQLAPGAGRT